MRKRAVLALLIVLMALFSGTSWGADLNGLQPPAPYGVFSTMTADSPAKGQMAVAGIYDVLLDSSFYRFGLNTAYGINDRLELSMSVSDQRDGFEDIAFGLKHRFIDKGPDGPSVAYLVTASPDTGNEETGTGGRFGGGVILSDRVGPVNGHLNLFYAVPADSDFEDELRASTGMVFAASHNVWLLGELYARSSHYSQNLDQLEARVGYRMLIAEGLYADLGVGADFKQEPTDYRIMATLAFQYPREEKKIKKLYEEK